MFIQAQYVFIHKAILEVLEAILPSKGGNRYSGYSSLYVNRKLYSTPYFVFMSNFVLNCIYSTFSANVNCVN